MANCPNYQIDETCVHDTDEDLDFTIRTNNGRLFDCRLDPAHFVRSPRFTKEYMQCLEVLRSGECEDDDYYEEDAWEFLKKPFEPLIAKLASGPLSLPPCGRPNLSQYLFPPRFCCTLDVVDDEVRPRETQNPDNRWGEPGVRMSDNVLREMRQWTPFVHPTSVQLCYKNAEDVLIGPPRKVIVPDLDGSERAYYYKEFRSARGVQAVEHELRALGKIVMAKILPSQALVCSLHGIVADGPNFFGMLLTLIDVKEFLSRGLATETPADIRKRWAAQIRGSLNELHKRGIVWGDVKAENVLIDKEDNAWLTDFGPGYTEGWVDKDKVGTVEGDLQGLAKIMDMLHVC